MRAGSGVVLLLAIRVQLVFTSAPTAPDIPLSPGTSLLDDIVVLIANSCLSSPPRGYTKALTRKKTRPSKSSTKLPNRLFPPRGRASRPSPARTPIILPRWQEGQHHRADKGRLIRLGGVGHAESMIFALASSLLRAIWTGIGLPIHQHHLFTVCSPGARRAQRLLIYLSRPPGRAPCTSTGTNPGTISHAISRYRTA